MTRLVVNIDAELHILLIMSKNPLQEAEGKAFKHSVTVYGQAGDEADVIIDNLPATMTVVDGVTTVRVTDRDGSSPFAGTIADVTNVEVLEGVLSQLAVEVMLARTLSYSAV